MRILFVHRWLGVRLGGTETHIKELMRRFAARGHEVHVLTLRDPQLAALGDRVVVHRIRRSPGEDLRSYGGRDPRLYLFTILFALKIFVALIGLGLRNRFDVVSVHFVTEAWVARLLRPFFRWAIVFVMEGYTDHEAREARHSDVAVAISNEVRMRCEASCRFRPWVIPVGIEPKRFYPSERAEDARATRVLSVGRLVPEKNYGLLLEAFARASRAMPNLTLDIVGEGRERPFIERRIRELRLARSIRLQGAIPDDKLPEIYRRGDIFVATQNTTDAFLITLLEAMATGLPVIATNPGGRMEVLGDAGVVVPPDDAAAIAREILDFATNPSRYAHERQRNLRHARSYHWDELMPAYERAYETAARARARARTRGQIAVSDGPAGGEPD